MVAVCDSSDGTSDVVLINTKSQAEPTCASDGLYPRAASLRRSTPLELEPGASSNHVVGRGRHDARCGGDSHTGSDHDHAAQ
jgi:hypothetical protein